MKILFVISCIILGSCHSVQQDNLSLINPLPVINAVLMDSVTPISTVTSVPNRPTLLVYFDPDCHNCEAEIEELVKNHLQIKDINVYLMSIATYETTKRFVGRHHLDQYRNVIIAKDTGFTYSHLFKSTQVPINAVYNERKELKKVYIGKTNVAQLVKAIHE